jgi:hypothetical protein
MNTAALLTALKIALTLEPVAEKAVSDVIDLWNRHKSGQQVTQDEVDAALAGLKSDVDAFNTAPDPQK